MQKNIEKTKKTLDAIYEFTKEGTKIGIYNHLYSNDLQPIMLRF